MPIDGQLNLQLRSYEMPSINVDIDLSILEDVTRGDVQEFLEAHAYALNSSDVIDLLDDDDKEEVALRFLRERDVREVRNLLEAASFTENVLDGMSNDELIAELLARTVQGGVDRGHMPFLTRMVKTRLDTLNKEYDSFLRELLALQAIKKAEQNMAQAAQSAVSH
jgi:hypothetical protein